MIFHSAKLSMHKSTTQAITLAPCGEERCVTRHRTAARETSESLVGKPVFDHSVVLDRLETY